MPRGKGPNSFWSDDREQKLRELWKEGHSCSEIARRIGGVTRNGVVGKVHRLGLEERKTPSRPVRKLASQRRSRPHAWEKPPPARMTPKAAAPVEPPASVGNAPDDTRNAVLALSLGHCRWPIGDPKRPGFRFCMGETDPDHTFCVTHRKVAYQQVPQRMPRHDFDR